MVGARATALTERLAAEAKERQRAAGGDRKSDRAKSVPERVPEPIVREQTRDQIGKLVGVSGRCRFRDVFQSPDRSEFGPLPPGR